MKVRDYIPRERKETDDLVICETEEDYAAARELIQAYSDSIGVDLRLQNIDHELENLKIFYGPPTGMIILAREDGEFVGDICFRNLGDFMAEIKRMYVKPEYRNRGIGRKLLERAKQEAKGLGYRFIRLDTVPEMESAINLYLSAGFYEIESYAYSPYSGTRFMEYNL